MTLANKAGFCWFDQSMNQNGQKSPTQQPQKMLDFNQINSLKLFMKTEQLPGRFQRPPDALVVPGAPDAGS
jgi:hypothetical protein